jgi:hypothetical protein
VVALVELQQQIEIGASLLVIGFGVSSWSTDAIRGFWGGSNRRNISITSPETLLRWHRAGFRRYWRWKSRSRAGRPPLGAELRALIVRMSPENPLCGAPRIHGELLKLGFAVAQSSVAKYMVKRQGRPGQGWSTFLHNHAPDIAAM